MGPNQPPQSSNTQSGNSQSPMQTVASKPGGSNTLIYMVAVVVVVIIIIGLVFLFSGPSTPAITQNQSASSTPIYMSSSQAATVLNSPLEDYNTQDMFSLSAPINISFLEQIVPNIYGNVTSAWITSAIGSNLTSNASIEYMVFETTNSTDVAGSLYSAVESSYNSTIPTTYGTQNGLSYSYGVYKNATYGTQILSGWKDNGVVFVLIQSYPSFTANESELVGIAANDTP